MRLGAFVAPLRQLEVLDETFPRYTPIAEAHKSAQRSVIVAEWCRSEWGLGSA